MKLESVRRLSNGRASRSDISLRSWFTFCSNACRAADSARTVRYPARKTEAVTGMLARNRSRPRIEARHIEKTDRRRFDVNRLVRVRLPVRGPLGLAQVLTSRNYVASLARYPTFAFADPWHRNRIPAT